MPTATIKVAELRSRLGLTQQEFASMLGISTVSVNRWERGRADPEGPRAAMLEMLDEALMYEESPFLVGRLRRCSSWRERVRVLVTTAR